MMQERRLADNIAEERARKIAAYASMTREEREQEMYEQVVTLSLLSDQQPARCEWQKTECMKVVSGMVGTGDNATVSLGPFNYTYKGKNAVGITLFAFGIIGILVAAGLAIWGAVDKVSAAVK